MSRGRGARSKLEGRISGYETADFTIVSTPLTNPESNINFNSATSTYTAKKKMHVAKKILLGFGGIIMLLFVIGVISNISNNDSWDGTYKEPKVITPETAAVKPNAYTQRQLTAEDERDKKIGELLKDGWTMNNNEVPSNDYVTVGKKWEGIRTNPSPLISVTTSFQYDPKEQKYENTTITLKLQEIKENSGISVDSTVTNILKIYDPEINIDSINSSVQAAYNATINSKPYQGSLTFDKNYVHIDGSKSGRLIDVTIDVNTSVSNY